MLFNFSRSSYSNLEFQKIEQGLNEGGFNGKHCVLRAICELSETPIHRWTLFGEMITNLLK